MVRFFDSSVITAAPSKEGVYQKPIYYGLIHVGCGYFAFHYPWFGLLFLLYQLSQLILNRRFFVFQGRMERGNNVGHTAFKLTEFLIGMALAYAVHTTFPAVRLPYDRFSRPPLDKSSRRRQQ